LRIRRGVRQHDGVDHELQGPRLEDPEGDLGEHGDEAARDETAVRSEEGAEEPAEAPQRARLGRAIGAHARTPACESARPAAANVRSTIWRHVRVASTSARAARPIARRRSGSPANASSASARRTASDPGTSTPVRPSSTSAGSWPTREATTARPAAMYSMTLSGEKYAS